MWKYIAQCFLVALTASAQLPAMPKANASARKGVTGVTLDIHPGMPPETVVSNMTTGVAIAAARADAVTFSGLPDKSTNQFVAFNSHGSSAVLTTLATNQVIASRIEIHSYKVTVPTPPMKATRVMMSTNLLTWYQIALVSSSNTTHQFIWTNRGESMRFFRSVSP